MVINSFGIINTPEGTFGTIPTGAGIILKKEPTTIWTAPTWDDEAFESPIQIDINIKDMPDMIESTARICRENIPQSNDEVVAIKQTPHKELVLEIQVRDGSRFHSDYDLWVTKKTFPYIQKLLCAVRTLKPQIESSKNLEKGKGKEIYHLLLNAFRYVYEPIKPDIDNKYVTASGNEILCDKPCIEAIYSAPNVRRITGYVFAGDEPGEYSESLVNVILSTLRELCGTEPQTKYENKGGIESLISDLPMSPRQIANKYNLPLVALQGRLKRLRKTNLDCFLEVNDRKMNESQFLYKMKYINPIIEKMKTTSHRPTKKNIH
jgi:hypothetical protein